MAKTPVVYGPHPNGDQDLTFGPARYIGNFHKTLPHNEFGEVVQAAYATFADIAANGDFKNVPEGPLTAPHQTPLSKPAAHVAKLVNPQAGRSTDTEGPDPLHMEMQPAPRVLGDSTAAEMTELYWMALWRDSPFETWTAPNASAVIADLSAAFGNGLADTADPGRLQLGADLPQSGGALNLTPQTLFRMGLDKEDKGPLISQFLLQDFNYGAHFIQQSVIPYRAKRNHLLSHGDWLLAQNTGYDVFANDYSSDNSWAADHKFYDDPPAGVTFPSRVRLRNMRDLARFVNRDALHQAYFNAALQILNWGGAVALDAGNPYTGAIREAGFGTLGGPNLLALVSEVASRAAKVVWRQKWLVHRRTRPEVYGGLMQMQKKGLVGTTRAYGLPDWVFDTEAAQAVQNANNGDFFLPMAYSAGSPAHPSYGAGHASVAGACVTILKAWFKDTSFQGIIAAASAPGKDPGSAPQILQPGTNNPDGSLPAYTDVGQIDQMTLHGELNKLAANVAMGRTMGGVHWRSDNTRSLRLGERVATIILRRQMPTFAERPLQMSYVNFDGDNVVIESNGKVQVPNDSDLETFYSHF